MKINKNWLYLFLLGLFFISFFLRFYKIPENLFFGPEQGIDFLAIRNIAVNHKMTLIGAKTDISGVFHGPIYYYLAVIPFLLTAGSPIWISAFYIILNSLTVFFIYYLGEIMISKRAGIIASLIFAFSFGAIVYSRWLSNPPLSIPLSVLFFICLLKFLQGKSQWLYLAAISFGLLGQAEFLNYIFYTIILLAFIFINRKKFMLTNKLIIFLSFFLLVISSVSTYILFDIRHSFLISKSLLNLLSGHSGYYVSLSDSFSQTFFIFFKSFSTFIFPMQIWISSIILLFGLWIMVFKKYENLSSLFLWLFVPFFLLVFLRHSVLEQFFVSIVPGTILLTAVVIDYFWKRNKLIGILLLFLLIGVQASSWLLNIPNNKGMFFQSTQPNLKFSDQKKVIDTIYKKSNREHFSFQAYTIPYWSQQAWEYLFWQYGRKKYGSMPVSEKAKQLFVIIQDDPSNKEFQRNWLTNTVSHWGVKEQEFRYGVLRIQKLKIE